MATSDEKLASVLQFDSLATAEDVTGASYKDDPWTMAKGFGMHLKHVAVKDQMLSEADDTVLCNDLARYERIIADEGFTLVLMLPFQARVVEKSEMQNERMFVYAHRDGIVLRFDTYGGTRVNSGDFCYVWKQRDEKEECYGITSSGGGIKDPKEEGKYLWAGSHDCREALRFHIRQFRAHGSFITPWPERPFAFNLLHWGDYKQDRESRKNDSEDRVKLLPEWAQVIVGPARKIA